MVRAQMLSELEEIVNYKQHADQPERQAAMRKTWMKRLQGCQPDVEVWQRILQVRALVLSPEDDPVMWIKFANLCRKSDRMFLAEKTINSLLWPDRVWGPFLLRITSRSVRLICTGNSTTSLRVTANSNSRRLRRWSSTRTSSATGPRKRRKRR